MSKVLYSRISTDRARRFSVRTEITTNITGTRVDRKTPAALEAEEHLRKMARMEGLLASLYDGSRIRVNRCAMSGGALEIEYVEGETLEKEFDRILVGEGAEALRDAVRAYLGEVFPDDKMTETGEVSPEFTERFGELPGRMIPFMSLPVTDIDMIPGNVLSGRDGLTLLDYEWTFDFPVPASFAMYRILYYYPESSPMRRNMLPLTWYSGFGISKEDARSFREMEEHFQRYMRGESGAEDAAASEGDAPAVVEEASGTGSWSGLELLQVFFSDGSGFEPENVLYYPFTGRRVDARIRVPENAVEARLDPGDRCGACRIEGLRLEGSDEDLFFRTNGTRLSDDRVIFTEEDPQLIVRLPEGSDRVLLASLEIEHYDREKLDRMASRKRRGKSFFTRLRENLKKKRLGETPLCHIESQVSSPQMCVVRGWAYDPDSDVKIRVTRADGTEIPFEIHRFRRPDVEEEFSVTREEQNGFLLFAMRGDIGGDEFTLDLRAGMNRRSVSLSANENNFIAQIEQNLPGAGKYHSDFVNGRPSAAELEEQRRKSGKMTTRFSIVIPLYNTRPMYLDALLESVTAQSYPPWQLCLADGSSEDFVEEEVKKWLSDDRVRYVRLRENLGISGNTNAALDLADGDFIVLADHDDVLEADALYNIAKAIDEDPSLDILYTDEDLTDETGTCFFSPRYKPDFDPDRLCCVNYICHILAIRRSVMDEAGHFRTETDGAQDWDMILRCSEKTDRIRHIPKVLYHWRSSMESTAGNPESKGYAIEAGRRAIRDHMDRTGAKGDLEYTGLFVVFRPVLAADGTPRVTALMSGSPGDEKAKEKADDLAGRTEYPELDIIVTEAPEDEEPEGEYVVFIDSDMEAVSPDWADRLLGYCAREGTGIVGTCTDDTDPAVKRVDMVPRGGAMMRRDLYERFRNAGSWDDICAAVRGEGLCIVNDPGVRWRRNGDR